MCCFHCRPNWPKSAASRFRSRRTIVPKCSNSFTRSASTAAFPADLAGDAVEIEFEGCQVGSRPVQDWLSRRAHAGGDLMSAVTERKAALVTGGAVRLGRAIAISLAAAGFDIALHYNRSEAEALTAAADIRARGARCELFQHDLCQIHHLDSMIASVASKFPGTQCSGQ